VGDRRPGTKGKGHAHDAFADRRRMRSAAGSKTSLMGPSATHWRRCSQGVGGHAPVDRRSTAGSSALMNGCKRAQANQSRSPPAFSASPEGAIIGTSDDGPQGRRFRGGNRGRPSHWARLCRGGRRGMPAFFAPAGRQASSTTAYFTRGPQSFRMQTGPGMWRGGRGRFFHRRQVKAVCATPSPTNSGNINSIRCDRSTAKCKGGASAHGIGKCAVRMD